ncbi:MAG: NAD(P)H-dependent oxidoreductase subunit E, partial [Sediminibacterium sp.]
MQDSNCPNGEAKPTLNFVLSVEYLHRIQDKHHHLSDQHLLALATIMKISQAEVYEVASFYHHFD